MMDGASYEVRRGSEVDGCQHLTWSRLSKPGHHVLPRDVSVQIVSWKQTTAEEESRAMIAITSGCGRERKRAANGRVRRREEANADEMARGIAGGRGLNHFHGLDSNCAQLALFIFPRR